MILCNGYIHFYVSGDPALLRRSKEIIPHKGKQFKTLGRKKLPLLPFPEVHPTATERHLFTAQDNIHTAVQMLNIWVLVCLRGHYPLLSHLSISPAPTSHTRGVDLKSIPALRPGLQSEPEPFLSSNLLLLLCSRLLLSLYLVILFLKVKLHAPSNAQSTKVYILGVRSN